jgi:hypothetical protein
MAPACRLLRSRRARVTTGWASARDISPQNGANVVRRQTAVNGRSNAINLARGVFYTVHVMHAGRVAESGSPAQIFENPREEVTRTFLAQTKAN